MSLLFTRNCFQVSYPHAKRSQKDHLHSTELANSLVLSEELFEIWIGLGWVKLKIAIMATLLQDNSVSFFGQRNFRLSYIKQSSVLAIFGKLVGKQEFNTMNKQTNKQTWKHKIWETNLLHYPPKFIALHIFNDIETCRSYRLMTNPVMVKKFIERLHLQAYTKLYTKVTTRAHKRTLTKPFFPQSA